MSTWFEREGRERLSWENMYKHWRAIWSYGEDFAADPGVIEMFVASPEDGRRIGDNIVDWWPITEIETRRAYLRKYGTLGVQWKTYAGTFRTAQMLERAKGNPEAVAAVWIAASFWDMEHDLPDEWRGLIARLISAMDSELRAVLGRMQGVGFWDHRERRALPERLLIGNLPEIMRPQSFRDLLEIVRLHVALVRSAWAIVRVSHGRPFRLADEN